MKWELLEQFYCCVTCCFAISPYLVTQNHTEPKLKLLIRELNTVQQTIIKKYFCLCLWSLIERNHSVDWRVCRTHYDESATNFFLKDGASFCYCAYLLRITQCVYHTERTCSLTMTPQSERLIMQKLLFCDQILFMSIYISRNSRKTTYLYKQNGKNGSKLKSNC